MFERFTVESRAVVLRAQDEARQLRHTCVGTEHLLLALLDPAAGAAYTVLHDAGVDAAQVRASIVARVDPAEPIISANDAAALRTIGIDADAVLARIEEAFGPMAVHRTPCRSRLAGRFGFSKRAKKVLELALREAVARRDHHIGSEHLLLGVLREANGLAAQILADTGCNVAELRSAALAALAKAA